MNEQKIQELIQRYFDGSTSLAEERELQRLFASEKLPESLEVYRPLFSFFAEEKAIEPPVDKRKAKLIRLSWVVTAGVAASIAILFLITLPHIQPEQYVYYVDGQRIYDETAAIESAKGKLQLLAASVQKAKDGMSAFERVQESGQSLQQFNKISNAYQQVEKIVSGSKLEDDSIQ